MRRKPNPLRKKAKRGFRGYPIATVAFYGPDDRRASKVAVGIVADDAGEVVELERWFVEEADARSDLDTGEAIEAFIRSRNVRSVVLGDRIIGCPHEEGIDYPEGQACSECPYWAGRDRFSGERVN